MPPPFASSAVEAAPVHAPVVLLVEDQAEVRAVVRRVLERAAFRVLEADTGLEALRLWREHAGSVDVLLTDLRPRWTPKSGHRWTPESRPSHVVS